jgi:hypothetical protein
MYLFYSHLCYGWWLQVCICFIHTYAAGGDYRYVFVIFKLMLQVGITGIYLLYSHWCYRWGLQVFICYFQTYVTGGDYRYSFVLFTLMLQVVITDIYSFDLFLILNIVNVALSDILSALIKYTLMFHIKYNHPYDFLTIQRLRQQSIE